MTANLAPPCEFLSNSGDILIFFTRFLLFQHLQEVIFIKAINQTIIATTMPERYFCKTYKCFKLNMFF